MSSGSLRNSSNPKVPLGREKMSTQRLPSSVWWLASTSHDLSSRDDMGQTLITTAAHSLHVCRSQIRSIRSPVFEVLSLRRVWEWVTHIPTRSRTSPQAVIWPHVRTLRPLHRTRQDRQWRRLPAGSDQRVTKKARSVWFWRCMLALGIALTIDFLIDDKFIPLVLALAWSVAMLVAIRRLRRQRA
jgi:hypothetical protein